MLQSYLTNRSTFALYLGLPGTCVTLSSISRTGVGDLADWVYSFIRVSESTG